MTTDFIARRSSLDGGFRRFHHKAPAVAEGFFATHKAAMVDGALSTATKELIALAIAIAVHCDGCIAFHVSDALGAGATHEQIVETVGVAVLMGGGPAMVYGSDALDALEQFAAAGDGS